MMPPQTLPSRRRFTNLTCRKLALLLLASLSLPPPRPTSATFVYPSIFFPHLRQDPVRSFSSGDDAFNPNMAKQDSPSAQRNKDPIWEVLSSKVFTLLPQREEPLHILEIAAGCGVHSHYFSLQLAQKNIPFLWYPSDPETSSWASIQAYLDDEPILKGKLQSPLDLTLEEGGLVDDTIIARYMKFDVIICINMIHISPWSATMGLMKLAERHLKQGGFLFLYGPYKVNGQAVESNL